MWWKLGILSVIFVLLLYFVYQNGKMQCKDEQKTEIIRITEKDGENKSKIIALPNASRDDIIELMLNGEM